MILMTAQEMAQDVFMDIGLTNKITNNPKLNLAF